MKNFSICILCVILISTLFSGCHRHSSENIDESYEVVVSDVPEEDMSSGINNLQELISFLTEQKEKGHLINTVVYPHPLTDDDFDLLCNSTGSMCTSYTSSGDEYTFTLTLYPGDRIAQAYFSGDTSQLKEDEIKVLQIAEQMVSQARATARSPLELELLLHDMLLEKATYYRGSTDIPDSDNPPRHLTVVGALLDGRANCQGFTDAFFTLATIAGFKVGRMSVTSDGDAHMLNTIYLDGAWYVVDSTIHNNDNNGGDVEYLYPHFNAGLDMCGSLNWHPEAEYKKIAKVSNQNYYYNIRNDSPRHNYQKTYTDLTGLARAAISEFTAGKRNVVHLMLLNHKATNEDISEALHEAGNGVEFPFNYTYWQEIRGNHTYISIRFSR